METERLFDTDPYQKTFTAKVQSCTEERDGWAVVLDRTAFYPEGGGQPGDHGTLGDAAVTDTLERDGEVIHICDAPLPVGRTVNGAINWTRRFDMMQQHSGEHIVSGIICKLFSCDNVGFHLGADIVVIDFNTPIPEERLAEIEFLANEVIWENRPFIVSYPSPEALKDLVYRSKKKLSGRVRIVECPGADRCACCGTHVRSAGELGLVKLLSVRTFREGVRIEMLSGQRAYRYVSSAAAQNEKISAMLSAKPDATATAVARVQRELSDTKYRMIGLENRIFVEKAAALAGKGDVLCFEDGLSMDALRRCCDAIGTVCGGRCAVFSSDANGGYRYAIGCRGGDLRALTKAMNAALGGRGGGKPEFVQGSVAADRAEIEAFFEEI